MLNIFVETDKFVQVSLINRKSSRTAFIRNGIVFTVTFDQFNASLQNKSIILLKKFTDPKFLNDNVCFCII